MNHKAYIVILIIFMFVKCNSMNQYNLTGRDVNIFKNSPVWNVALAIRDNDTSKVRQLLTGQPSSILNYREKYFGQSLLNWAVYRDNYSSAKVLVELGADPNLKSNDSTSAMIHAADKAETKYLKLLLQYGGNVNAIADIDAPQDLRTPLIAAAFKNLENVKLLVESGANANYIHRSKRGNIGGENIQSALIYAFMGGKIDIVEYLLIEVGVDYNYVFNTTINGDTLYILRYLREMPFSLDSEEYKMKMHVVKFLKDHGLDYKKEPIPELYLKNYDSNYLEKY